MYDHPNASLPPPAGFPSALTFVTRFLLAGVAVVAGIALILTASPAVAVPLGSIFLVYLIAALVLTREPGPAFRIRSGAGALAAVSVGMLGGAFVVPERFGAALAGLGLLSLVVVRIIARPAGWTSRGAAWGERSRGLTGSAEGERLAPVAQHGLGHGAGARRSPSTRPGSSTRARPGSVYIARTRRPISSGVRSSR